MAGDKKRVICLAILVVICFVNSLCQGMFKYFSSSSYISRAEAMKLVLFKRRSLRIVNVDGSTCLRQNQTENTSLNVL